MKKFLKVGVAATLIGSALTMTTPVFAGDIIYDNRTGAWQYTDDSGMADNSYTGVTNNKHGWWYVKKGKVDFKYNGFASNRHGWWYIENGKVTFGKNDVINGTVNGENAWWNVKGSKVLFNESIEPNVHGWWYIKNGKADFGYTGVKSNIHGWWYVKNGKVDFNYNGFAKNENGWWYIENGKVTFNKNGVVKGTVDGVTTDWNVKNSKVTGKAVSNSVDAEYAKMVRWSKDDYNNDFNDLTDFQKAITIMAYVASHFRYGDGSYTAESMIEKGYGTCFGFSDLTYKFLQRAGIRDSWLTVAGRNVDHGGKMYGSAHRTVVARFENYYYDIDSNLLMNNLPMIEQMDAMGIDVSSEYVPELITKSYADYLTGKTDSYTGIN